MLVCREVLKLRSLHFVKSWRSASAVKWRCIHFEKIDRAPVVNALGDVMKNCCKGVVGRRSARCPGRFCKRVLQYVFEETACLACG